MRNAWDLANMGSKKIAAMISLNFIEALFTRGKNWQYQVARFN